MNKLFLCSSLGMALAFGFSQGALAKKSSAKMQSSTKQQLQTTNLLYVTDRAKAKQFLREAVTLAAELETEMKQGHKTSSFFQTMFEAYAAGSFPCINNMYSFPNGCPSDIPSSWNDYAPLAADGFKILNPNKCTEDAEAQRLKAKLTDKSKTIKRGHCGIALAGAPGDELVCSNNTSGGCVTDAGMQWLQDVYDECKASNDSPLLTRVYSPNDMSLGTACEQFHKMQGEQIEGVFQTCEKTVSSKLKGGSTCKKIRQLKKNIEAGTPSASKPNFSDSSVPQGRERSGSTEPLTLNEGEGAAKTCSSPIVSSVKTGKFEIDTSFGYENVAGATDIAIPTIALNIKHPERDAKYKIFLVREKGIERWCANVDRPDQCIYPGKSPQVLKFGENDTIQFKQNIPNGELDIVVNSKADQKVVLENNGLTTTGERKNVNFTSKYTIRPGEYGPVDYHPGDGRNSNVNSWDKYQVDLASDAGGAAVSEHDLETDALKQVAEMQRKLKEIADDMASRIQMYGNLSFDAQMASQAKIFKIYEAHLAEAIALFETLPLQKEASVEARGRMESYFAKKISELKALQKCAGKICADNLAQTVARMNANKKIYDDILASPKTELLRTIGPDGNPKLRSRQEKRAPEIFTTDTSFSKTVSCPAVDESQEFRPPSNRKPRKNRIAPDNSTNNGSI